MRTLRNIISKYEKTARYYRDHDDWISLGLYYSRLNRELAEIRKVGSDEAVEVGLFNVQVLFDLATAHSMMRKYRNEVTSIQKGITLLRSLPHHASDMHGCYIRLYNAHLQLNEFAEANRAIVKSMTCWMTVQESEWIAVSLVNLAGLELAQGRVESSECVGKLADDLRFQRRYAKRPTVLSPPIDSQTELSAQETE